MMLLYTPDKRHRLCSWVVTCCSAEMKIFLKRRIIGNLVIKVLQFNCIIAFIYTNKGKKRKNNNNNKQTSPLVPIAVQCKPLQCKTPTPTHTHTRSFSLPSRLQRKPEVTRDLLADLIQRGYYRSTVTQSIDTFAILLCVCCILPVDMLI